MTVNQAKEAVLNTARKELGYHEQGDNITKYAIESDIDTKLYGFDMNGSPWCDYFVDWVFCKTFGYDRGRDMTYQYDGCSGAACRFSASYYQNHGQYFQYPEVGDQIFFYYGGDINHTGIVESVIGTGTNWSQVVTIEGNSSDMVARNTYSRGNSCIAGFGRPNWSLAADQSIPKEEEPKQQKQEQPINMDNLFLPGDVVKITGNTYYGGKVAIPAWVKAKNWVVMSVYGDRAVINQDENNTIQIMSPININDITLVKAVDSSNRDSIKTKKTYIVKSGDTLWNIAQKQLNNPLKYKEIKKLNKLTSNKIIPGQELELP